MRYVLGLVIALAGCGGGVRVGIGHRGLVFDPEHGGLHREVLVPGYHRVGRSARVIDYDVTYSTHLEPMKLVTIEGLPVDLKLAVVYRPIVAELYELQTEIGPQYYDEVLGPELRVGAHEEIAKRAYADVIHGGVELEDAIENAVRRRIAGKHIELASVTLR